MNLGIVGLLMTMSNMAYYGGPGWELSDMSVIMEEVSTLKKNILEQPGFDLENFRYNTFSRVGRIGIFASNNLRKYLFPELHIDGVDDFVSRKESGVLVIFYYTPRTTPIDSKEEDQTLHILALDKEVDADVARGFLRYAVADS